MARYELRAIGVFDRVRNAHVMPRTPEWQEYLALLAEGEHPDPMPPAVVPLEQQRAEMRAKVNARRRQAMNAGVTFDGHRYQSDPASRQAIARRSEASAPWPLDFAWRDADNVDVPMSRPTFVFLAQAMLEHEHACMQRAWELKALIDASDEPTSIDIAAGWP